MRPGRRDDLLLLAAALVPLALYLSVEQGIAGAAGFPLDDSWIHLHFARNLASGAGFSYNPGIPVAGSTAPLWTALLAGAVRVLGPTLLAAKLLGIACTYGAAVVTRRAAIAWGVTPGLALAAAVALLWAGPAAWGALSGMEVSLAALLVAAALLAHARDAVVLTAVLGTLAVLARPETLLLLPLLAAARPVDLRRLATFGLVGIVVLAPAVWFSVRTVGRPLPLTAMAKVEGGLLGWLQGVHEPAFRLLAARPTAFLGEWVAWLARIDVLLPLALLIGPAIAWRRGGRALGIPALALLAHPLGMALLAPYRGPGFQEGRYSIHLLPLALIVLALAGDTLRRLRRPATAVFLALALVALGPAARRYAWAVQNINTMQVAIGHWVDANVPASARLALNDIGAIAYVSRRPVIDLMGLVTPDIIPYRREGEAGVIRYIVERCPDYVIVFPAWFPRLTARTDLLEPVHRVRLDHNEVAGAAEVVVYRVRRCAL